MRNLHEQHNEQQKKPLWKLGRAEENSIPKTKERTNFGEVLFFIAFFAFFLKATMDFSGVIPRNETSNSMLVGLSIACSMAKILTQRYTPLRFALTISVCLIIGYSSLISINYLFLLGFLLIIGMQDMDFIRIIKVAFYSKIVNISIHVSWYIVVYFTNPSVIRFVFRGGTGEPRHYFFMGHANTFSSFLIWACLDYIIINYQKLNIFHIAVIWLINIIFYSFTLTNTGIMLLTVVSILIALDKCKWAKKFFDKLFTFLAKYIYTFCAVAFPFLAVIYINLGARLKEMWHTLDDFLTGRIWFGVHAYYEYGPTWFGIPDMSPRLVFWYGRWFRTMTVFDNHYLGNFLSYGMIHSILTILVLIVFCGRMENKEKIIMATFALYAIMSSSATNLTICSALFIIGKYLYPDTVKKTIKNN
jgi:hypothetical protein